MKYYMEIGNDLTALCDVSKEDREMLEHALYDLSILAKNPYNPQLTVLYKTLSRIGENIDY